MNINEEEKKIHNSSWEIEILISGGAFFSLYQLSTVLYAFSEKLQGLVAPDLSGLGVWFLAVFLTLGIRILSIYFAVHLTVRAFWLSLVLLQKIYPQGINIGRLRSAEPFLSNANKFDLGKRITSTDKLSGLVFSWAITFVIIYTGIILTFGLPTILFTQIDREFPSNAKTVWWMTIRVIFMLSIYVFFIDTFFYGFLRRSKFLAKFYYPIFVFWNTLSLGVLWRPSLQIIFTNVKSRWKASVVALLATIVVGFCTLDEDDYTKMLSSKKNPPEEIMVNESRYLDKRTDETKMQQQGSFIHSDIITDNVLKVFVNYNDLDAKYVDSLKTEKKYFSKIIKLSIDDSVYGYTTWIGIDRINGQTGIQTVIDISHLDKKMHILQIERMYEDKINLGSQKTLRIPFWKL